MDYEKKLKTVMERLGVNQYSYDWTRHDCYVQFAYKGQNYRFEHTIEKAKASGHNITSVSDLFASLVLSLEDITRAIEKGIFDLGSLLQNWRQLPPARPEVPGCLQALQFDSVPTETELRQRYRELAKTAHPDTGGDAQRFDLLKRNFSDAMAIVLSGEAEG
ncbi:MAG: J domain-containing protein [Oscillospiraceae bacterium]